MVHATLAATAIECSLFRRSEWNDGATIVIDSKVSGEITNEVEVLLEASVVKHFPSVSTHWEHFTLLDSVVPIQFEYVLTSLNGTLVNDCLTIVLAMTLEIIKLEQPVGCRIAANFPKLLL